MKFGTLSLAERMEAYRMREVREARKLGLIAEPALLPKFEAPLVMACPRGCRQHCEPVYDRLGTMDREYVRCFYHGEVRIQPPPALDPPDTPRGGHPTYRGMDL